MMQHPQSARLWLLVAALVIALLVLTCGCTAQRSAAGGQAVADIRSAAQGIIAGAHPPAAPARAIVRLCDPAAAALGLDPAALPDPAISPAQWLADPAGAESQALSLADQLLELLAQVPWGAWIVGAGMVALGIGKRLLPGAAGQVAELAYRLLASRADRQRDAAAHALYDVIQVAQPLLAELAPDALAQAVTVELSQPASTPPTSSTPDPLYHA
jgi:hypothetical protein